jgi:type IV fimbrial biogenesis protein FimT
VPQGGFTLIEIVVALAIASLLALAAAPWFGDYGINARLREAGNLVYSETMYAQNEAIKRNVTIRVVVSDDDTLTVSDISNAASPDVLRTRKLPAGTKLPDASFSFGGSGWPTGMNAISLNVAHVSVSCSGDYRCPGLRVDAGGAMRLCADQNVSC